MAVKSKYDWEAIFIEYRSGVMSIREISRRHGPTEGTIRYRAKRHGWQRDLTEEVRKAAQQKLLRKNLRKDNVSDEEIVDGESDVLMALQLSMRKDIKALRDLETQLITELYANPTKKYITQYQGEIIEKEVGLTAAERAQAANNLANVQHKRIALERQAYNLDATRGITDPVKAILDEIAKCPVPLVKE